MANTQISDVSVGGWVWCVAHRQVGQVVDVATAWGATVYHVWLPDADRLVRLRADEIRPLAEGTVDHSARMFYVAAAARVAEALTQDVLLAPIESAVVPLPHQVRALRRVMGGERVRYLLADEVGLGKTIEAGLILRELKLRGRVKRTLVLAPKGLVTQWVAELRARFGEELRVLLPSEAAAERVLNQGDNYWRSADQVICSIDAVKPLESRRGWSREQVAAHNRARFEDLAAAGWDLVIVDEAHRLAGSTDQVARYRLGEELARVAPYLLLLSATPHAGKSDAFHRLMTLLDPIAFPDVASVTKERVRPYVIRTEKRQAIDAQGQRLFHPRQTRLVPIPWSDRHRAQRALYEAVTDYVREGYNQALRERNAAAGFLMVLLQWLVTSSTRAIRTTLERRLDVLQETERETEERFGSLETNGPADLFELDALLDDIRVEEQVDALVRIQAALRNEQAEVATLLDAARRAEARGVDPKAEALLDWIYQLQREEGDPHLKVLVFTEFVSTQEMLRQFLADRGFPVVCLNGSLDLGAREEVQRTFAGPARMLVSTDAGGEGLNLQFCHVVVNFDLPWNPMQLEQRIGRVDRIGQQRVVRALNFVLEDSVEHRVQEVLQDKLAVILNELGVDKAADVLDSAETERLFDELHRQALVDQAGLAARAESAMGQLRDQARATRENAALLAEAEPLDPEIVERVRHHPLPHWVELLTVSYLRSFGGRAEKRGRTWSLTWPDGERQADVVFTASDAEAVPSARRLTLEDRRIRDLVTRLPRVAPGQPIPRLACAGLPPAVRGYWSLWRIALHNDAHNDAHNDLHNDPQNDGAHRERVMPLFVRDDGRIFHPTARAIWDLLLTELADLAEAASPAAYETGDQALDVYRRVATAAEAHGRAMYDELLRRYQAELASKRQRTQESYAARRRVVERIGLEAVRVHRLARLDHEQHAWEAQLARRQETVPELVPLLLLRIEGGRADGTG